MAKSMQAKGIRNSSSPGLRRLSRHTLSGRLGMIMDQIEEMAISGEDQSRLGLPVQFGQISSVGYTEAGHARRRQYMHEDQREVFEYLDKEIMAE